MKYEKARAEVVLFDNSDVITTSSEVDWTDPSAGYEACGMGSMSQNGECSSMTWN